MANLDEMMADLAAADAAGDTELAQRIATQIKGAQPSQASGGLRGKLQAADQFMDRLSPAKSAGKALAEAVTGKAYAAPDQGKPQGPTENEASARGAFQGLSYGWGDEASAALAATMPFLDREAAGEGGSWGERYGKAREFFRGKNAAAEESHPTAYLSGEVGGAVLPAVVTGGAAAAKAPLSAGARLLRAVAPAAGQGAVQGAGYSDADTAAGVAGDSAVGLGLGVAGRAVGEGLGRLGATLRRKGAELVSRGTARANQQAAEESLHAVRQVEGAVGDKAANAYRQMERIELALANPALPPAERAAIEAFKKTPEYAALVAANAKSILAAAPEALAEREAAKVVATEAREALPGAIKSRTAELLTPQVKADTQSFVKGWVEPVVWAYGANKAAEMAGASPEQRTQAAVVAGLIGGRTRAGKALWSRLNRPAHQTKIGEWLQGAGKTSAGKRLLEMLALRGGPAATTAALVASGDDGGSQ